MTNEEALKMTIRECNYFEELSRDTNGKVCRDKGECKDCYANFVIKSLEKQIPKKYVIEREDGVNYQVCPNCKCHVAYYFSTDGFEHYEVEDEYCSTCGQKIDWSDYE